MKKLLMMGALALVANGAQAALSFTNPEETTEISQSGNLDLFDSNLGVLTSATLTLQGFATSSIDLTNNGANNELVSAIGNVNLFFQEAGIADLGIPDPAVTLNLDYTGGFISIASGATVNIPATTDSQSLVLNFNGAAANVFANAGGGSFGLDCFTISGLNLQGGGGNVDSSQSTTAGCGASIAYDFDQVQVPSPAPLALMAAGLVGLAGVRRLKK